MTNRQAIPNPFSRDVVTSPEQLLHADVPRIHQRTFDLCRKAYETVATESRSTSVLMYGEAGCGKTHLLSRFHRWLTGEMDSAPSTAAALFVAVRMETAPGQIWRHLRRRFAEELTRRNANGACPLDLLLHRFASAYQGSLSKALDSASVQDMGLDLMHVLEHFEAGAHRRLCRAWLAGDTLADADLQKLNLREVQVEDGEDDQSEASSRRVIQALVRLCAPAPVVFCFDQLEALGISQQSNSFSTFSRMGASLVDETTNTLVISTVLATFLADLEASSMRSDYQRISKDRADLAPLDWELGKALIDARLALIPELAGETPIPESRLKAFYEAEHRRFNPRRLIHEARRLFTEWQGKAEEPPVPMDDFLRGEFQQLWSGAEVRSNPALADGVLAQGLPVALQLMGRTTNERPPDLTVDGGSSRVNVTFGNQQLSQLAHSLKKLRKHPPPNAVTVVVRDQRLPITKAATVTQRLLSEIERDGGRMVRVDAESLAALDAMRRLLATATSGDLSRGGAGVEPQTVRDWLKKNLPREIVKFTGELLSEEPATPHDPLVDALIELVGKLKVVSVEEAARVTAWPQEQIENYARTHPLDLCFFGGPCPVVCRSVAAHTRAETNVVS